MHSLGQGAERQGMGNSLFHNIDARVKIVIAIFWSILLAVLNTVNSALVALVASLILILIARWPWKDLMKRLLIANTFVLFMWLMLPFSFSNPGQVVASIGPLDVTKEGLTLAILLTLKANGILIAVIALLGTSPLFVLAAAGRQLGFPEKLVNLFLLTIRYFYVMLQEYNTLRIAMRARAFKAGLNKNTVNSFGNLVGSLLVRSFDRADRVHRAMLCRGYTGMIWVKADFSLNHTEFAFSAIMIVLAMAVGGVEWYGG